LTVAAPELPAVRRASPGQEGLFLPLAEWERWTGVGESLAGSSGKNLVELSTALEPLVGLTPLLDGRVEVRARGRVGELATGSLHVRVRPRYPAGDLVRLFCWTQGATLHALDEQGVSRPGEATFQELLSQAMVREAERLLATDLVRRWQRRSDVLQILRGRPDFARMGERPPALGLPCRYQELSTDTLENRLVRAGLEAALRWIRPSQRMRARASATTFADLASAQWPCLDHYRLATLNRTPRTEGYRAALQLSRWLVLGGGPISTWGASGVSGWWLDMPALFERVVAKGVSAWAAERGWSVLPQKVRSYRVLDGVGESYQRVIPDLEVWDRNRLLAIVDAKYKRYGEGTGTREPVKRIDRADLYQLAFYGASSPGKPRLVVASPAPVDGKGLAPRWKRLDVGGQHLDLIEVDLRKVVTTGTIPLPEVALTCRSDSGDSTTVRHP